MAPPIKNLIGKEFDRWTVISFAGGKGNEIKWRCRCACGLDRKNNDGNYAPGNCRWATKKQQARNMRVNRILTFDGESLPASEWAERLGIKVPTLFARLNKGKDIHRVLDPGINPRFAKMSACRRKH